LRLASPLLEPAINAPRLARVAKPPTHLIDNLEGKRILFRCTFKAADRQSKQCSATP